MIVVLVRHGQTQWNLEHRLQSDTDAPGVQLTTLGREQAAEIPLTFDCSWGDWSWDDAVNSATFYTSPLKRCLETLDCMGVDAHADRVVRDNDLSERSLGALAGLVLDRDVAKRLKAGAEEDGIETTDALMQRSRRALEAICAAEARNAQSGRNERIAVCVTHGAFMQSVGRWAGPNRKWPRVENGHVCVLRRDDRTTRWSILDWNKGCKGSKASSDVATFGGGDFG